MIEMYEKTGSLKVKSGRRCQLVLQNIIKEIAKAFVDRAQGNIVCISNARKIARNLNISYCILCKILRRNILFYPYQIRRLQEFRDTQIHKRKTFALTLIARMNGG